MDTEAISSTTENVTKMPVRTAASHPLRSSLWVRFFERCLLQRTPKKRFETEFKKLVIQHPLDGRALVYSLLDSQKRASSVADPLLLVYLEVFLASGSADAGQILSGLLLKSRHLDAKTQNLLTSKHNSIKNPIDLETRIFAIISNRVVAGILPTTPTEARNILLAVSKWMLALANPDGLVVQGKFELAHEMVDSMGVFVVAVLENKRMIGIIDSASSLALRKTIAKAIGNFLPVWAQYPTPIQEPNLPRLLEAFKARTILAEKQADFAVTTSPETTAAINLDAVLELPLARARASTFVFLSSLMFARPVPDDSLIMNFMQLKYKVNQQFDAESLAVDIIVGGFDLLSCAVSQKESTQTMFGLKSFLINKIPSLVSTVLVPLMSSPVMPEHCVQQAMSHVDPAVFPSMSQGMVTQSPLSDLKQQFLFSCVLHSLLHPDNVEKLLGEQPFSAVPDPTKKLVKEVLIQECTSDSERIVQLVEDLEKLDGNAGAMSLAIIEVIQNHCLMKDTMALKTICNLLSSKLRCLDVIMQFVNPSQILQPLCQLLDGWRYEDDQGEYQPSYEEFAAVFMLVLVFIHRYEIAPVDIGIPRDSFVSKYLTEGCQALPIDGLSDEKKKLLSTWIKGLFNPDSITDEVLSSCLPQEFYLLVPTLFGQLIHALGEKYLEYDALKVPLEYFLEPFLAPSLIGAIEWMVSQAVKLRTSFQPIVLVLYRLLSSIRNLQGIPQTVLAVSSTPLIELLFRVKTTSRPPTNNAQSQPVDVFLIMLRGHKEFRLSQLSPTPECLKTGSYKTGLRSSFDDLVSWSGTAQIEITQGPPKWTPKILAICIIVLGAKETVEVLAKQVHEQSIKAAGLGPDAMALDIATTMICSPTPGTRFSPTDWTHSGTLTRLGKLTLRDALKGLYEDAPRIYQKDQPFAETIARLYKRVETQMAASMNAAMATLADPMMPAMAAIADDSTAAALGLPADSLDPFASMNVALGADDGTLGFPSLDLDAGLGLLGAGTGAGSTDDDIFADLMNSGSFDLEGFD